MVNTARAVLIAVSDTDSSMLAFDSDDMKLLMFPPGHEATSSIPSAMVGEIASPSARMRRNVIDLLSLLLEN